MSVKKVHLGHTTAPVLMGFLLEEYGIICHGQRAQDNDPCHITKSASQMLMSVRV
jgi:hypothetical protein